LRHKKALPAGNDRDNQSDFAAAMLAYSAATGLRVIRHAAK